MNAISHKLTTLLKFSVLALLLIGGASAIWGALLYFNLSTTSSVPWALPVLMASLWGLWSYLGGKGWPRSTSYSRKRLLRANKVSSAVFTWSLIAGALAMVSLAGLWIVLFQLFPMHGNPLLPQNFTSSPLLIAAMVIGASLLAPIVEESAIRGYLQTALEREFRPVTAILLSSAVFAIVHLTQGLAWPKLMLYFLVGITFGSLAFLSDSILPVIAVHIPADLIFFLFVWPNDSGRQLVWQTGADSWFWFHIAQFVILSGLSLIAFRKLRQLRNNSLASQNRAGLPDEAAFQHAFTACDHARL